MTVPRMGAVRQWSLKLCSDRVTLASRKKTTACYYSSQFMCVPWTYLCWFFPFLYKLGGLISFAIVCAHRSHFKAKTNISRRVTATVNVLSTSRLRRSPAWPYTSLIRRSPKIEYYCLPYIKIGQLTRLNIIRFVISLHCYIYCLRHGAQNIKKKKRYQAVEITGYAKVCWVNK
jgi:hypothetical protein